jgi:hypothetical protein
MYSKFIQQFRPIEVLVKDDDTGKDDTCGVTVVPLDPFKLMPNGWAINHIFPLKDGDKQKGSIYICGKFIPDGTKDDGNMPQYLVHK